ncbi:organic solute transporter Ostalpha-domain-containing protein [Fomitopsis serialis]|uniref:organic solute transporter Ostalpha-domain-containing protein n=1 Tax=Fomitopsis serialis TaxID=139415 RepID=UPI002008267A|nr:organic solute transporter Ostalpha-domain-containing protein [Neoantrodia serialis]KAH9929265.1 organic solute transporter Ostalpha-domain-containing protein [Neoantrodia serialis]
MTNSTLCPSDNTAVVQQDSFWSSSGINWDAHRIGWIIAGCCACVSVLLTLFNVLQHARHYTNPAEQRQIIRVLYMPAVYASVTLSAFLLLLIEFVAATAAGHNVDNAIARKDKNKLPFPFCFWRYRPTKVLLTAAISIAGIICQAYGVLCESGPWSFKTANSYLKSLTVIALYGLIIFYALTKDELKGRRPLAKFLSIKLIVMFTFYQGWSYFDALEGRVIHATEYWTETNIANGLNALATCIEMVFFSAFMIWAFSHQSIGRPLWDSINYMDFAIEIAGSVKFFIDYTRTKMNLGEAFGVGGPQYTAYAPKYQACAIHIREPQSKSAPVGRRHGRGEHEPGVEQRVVGWVPGAETNGQTAKQYPPL